MPIKHLKMQVPLDDPCISMFEQSPVSIQIMSPDGRIIQVNEAWEELCGMTLDQLDGYNILKDKQLEKNGVMPYIKRAFDGQFTEIPLALYDPNETHPDATSHAEPKRWTKAIIYPVKNSAGQVREVVLMFEDLTVWRLAEEKRKANESLYYSLLENTSDIIYSHDLQGNCLSINSAGEKITGYSLEELKKMNIAQVIAPEHLELAKQMIECKSRDNTPTVYELDIITKNGHRLTLEINTRISSNKGQPLAVEGIARDITERKQTEKALRVSEARYRSLLENANDIIYSHDLLGNYVAVNGAAEKITGYSLEELKKMNIAQFIVPEQHERIKQVIERKLQDPTPSVHEFDIITKDGRRRTLEVNPKISAIEGQPLAIEGVARDVTERKEAEERLRESEERLRLATEAAQMYSWEVNLITQEIKYPENVGGVFNTDLLPKNFREVLEMIYPEDRQQLLREFVRARDGSSTFTNQYRAVSSPKKINWFESHAAIVRDEQGNPVSLIGITQNITERKQMEEVRHTWAERLEAAREDERRHLSRQLHDDVVQQLAVASIKLQRLEKRLIELVPEENAVFADLVMTQELLSRNQQSLRQVAHILHSGVLEQFGLAEAFRKFTKDIGALLKEQSTDISLDLSPDFPRLELAVENCIYRTVQEAVINALRHARAKSISLTLDAKDNLASVVIEDDGCGFDLKEKENTGIGFASMYERAEIINAKLNVESQNGKGTTISLEVPLKQSKRKAQVLSQSQ